MRISDGSSDVCSSDLGVARAVGRGTGALHRFFAEVRGMAAEWALVDGDIRITVERHAEVFEFVDGIGRLAAHEVDGILDPQPAGTLDGVVHVPVPVVFAYVGHRGADATMSRHEVGK